MKIIKLSIKLFYIMGMLITLTACPSDPNSSIELAVSPSTLTLDDNNRGEISIMSNTSWSIYVTESWINLSSTSGMEDRKIVVRASENTTGLTRNADLIISDRSKTETRNVTVIQQANPNQHKEFMLEVSLDSISFTSSASEATFDVISDQRWAIASNQTWCTVTPESGSDTKTIKVSVSQNTSTNERKAVITVNGNDNKQKYVNIIQQGAPSADIKPGEGDNNLPHLIRTK